MARSTQTERADVYTRITAEIVAAIEAGAGKWRMPWHHDGAAVSRPENVASRNRYRGDNVLAHEHLLSHHRAASLRWHSGRRSVSQSDDGSDLRALSRTGGADARDG